MSEPIPVLAARAIAQDHGRDVVVVVAWTRATNVADIVTYGKNAMDKMSAAKLGEVLSKAAGLGPPEVSHEDFRNRTAAGWAQEKDDLTKRIETLNACLIGSRAGFANLLRDRHELSDKDLSIMIHRLDQVTEVT